MQARPASYQTVTIDIINVPNVPPLFTSGLTVTIEELNVVCMVVIFHQAASRLGFTSTTLC